MPEMVLPGTYIEVRAEGLIAPGPFSAGNVGIVGTARRGKIASDGDPTSVYTPTNIGEARSIFGQYDSILAPEGPKALTLIRALELAFANGAQRVFAARVANTSALPTIYEVEAGGGTFIRFESIAPGTGYNGAQIQIGPYSLGLGIQVSGAGGASLESLRSLPDAPDDFVSQINAASRRFTAVNDGGTQKIAIDAAATRTTDGVDAIAAVFSLAAGTGTIGLTARQAGADMNGSSIEVAAGGAAATCKVTITGPGGVITETWNEVPRPPAEFASVLSGAAGGAYDYAANVTFTGTDASPSAGSSLFSVANNGGDANIADQVVNAASTAGVNAVAAVFSIPAQPGNVRLTAVPAGAQANDWVVTLNGYTTVTVSLGSNTETWRNVPTTPADFARVINGADVGYNYQVNSSTGRGSDLFIVNENSATGNIAADQKVDSAVQLGTDGADAESDDYSRGLDALAGQDVQIVVLAGEEMADILAAHVENASTDLMKHERIGVTGSKNSARRSDLVARAQDDGRLVYVGPGLRVFDAVANREVTLDGTYSAAAVAGRISSLDPHFSPTNKTINAAGLQTVFNGTDLEQLVLGRVMALEMKNGAIRIVRGITSSTNTAWAQVTTRRIVDYARNGVRAAADPFIGKLNNERVRQALKGSINSLLADMVDREMLISYELDVSATREQQIRGICQVTMVLRPTFSIDYIRVIMFLE